MKSLEDIQHDLNVLVESQTFSAAAAEGIAKLRKDLTTAISDNKVLLADVKLLNAKIAEQKILLDQSTQDISAFRARDGILAKREAAMYELEKKVAVNEASVNVFRECFGVVFRNVEVRREMFGSMPFANPGGYPHSGASNETTSTKVV